MKLLIIFLIILNIKLTIQQLTQAQLEDLINIANISDNTFYVINEDVKNSLDIFKITKNELNKAEIPSIGTYMHKNLFDIIFNDLVVVQTIYEYQDINNESDHFIIYCYYDKLFSLTLDDDNYSLILNEGYICEENKFNKDCNKSVINNFIIEKSFNLYSPTIVIDLLINYNEIKIRFYWFANPIKIDENFQYVEYNINKKYDENLINKCTSYFDVIKEYSRWNYYSLKNINKIDKDIYKNIFIDYFESIKYLGLTYLRNYNIQFYTDLYTTEILNLEINSDNTFLQNLLFLNKIVLSMYEKVRLLPNNKEIKYNDIKTSIKYPHKFYRFEIKTELLIHKYDKYFHTSFLHHQYNYDKFELENSNEIFISLTENLYIKLNIKRINSDNDIKDYICTSNANLVNKEFSRSLSSFNYNKDTKLVNEIILEVEITIFDETSTTNLLNFQADINICFIIGFKYCLYTINLEGTPIEIIEEGKVKYGFNYNPTILKINNYQELNIILSFLKPFPAVTFTTPNKNIYKNDIKNNHIKNKELEFEYILNPFTEDDDHTYINLNNNYQFFVDVDINCKSISYIKSESSYFNSLEPIQNINKDYNNFDKEIRDLTARVDDIEESLEYIEEILKPKFSIWDIISILGSFSDLLSITTAFAQYAEKFSKININSLKFKNDESILGYDIADNLVQAVNPKITQNLNIPDELKYSSFYDIAHGFKKIKASNNEEKLLDRINIKNLMDKNNILKDQDLIDFTISNSAINLKIHSYLMKELKIDYLKNGIIEPFGVVETFSSPIEQIKGLGKYLHDIGKNKPSTKNFNSNSCIKYPFHTSVRMRNLEINSKNEWIYTVRYTGVGEPSIIGPTNAKNYKPKLGYVKFDYIINKDTGELTLKTFDKTEKFLNNHYTELDIDQLLLHFTTKKTYKDIIKKDASFKWNYLEKKIRLQYENRNLLQSSSIQNHLFLKTVDRLFENNFIDGRFSAFKYSLTSQNCQSYAKFFTQMATDGFLSKKLHISDEGLLAFLEYYKESARHYAEKSKNFENVLDYKKVLKSHIKLKPVFISNHEIDNLLDISNNYIYANNTTLFFISFLTFIIILILKLLKWIK